MNRRSTAILFVLLVLVVSGCGGETKDHDPINVDTLPPGDATGTEASGTYEYEEVVTSSDCLATVDDVSIPVEAETWSTLAEITQDGGNLSMDMEDASGRPSVRLDGGIFASGSFRVGDTYYFRELVTFVHLMDGQFADGMDRFEGTTRIRVVGHDGTDCEIGIEFEGTRR